MRLRSLWILAHITRVACLAGVIALGLSCIALLAAIISQSIRDCSFTLLFAGVVVFLGFGVIADQLVGIFYDGNEWAEKTLNRIGNCSEAGSSRRN